MKQYFNPDDHDCWICPVPVIIDVAKDRYGQPNKVKVRGVNARGEVIRFDSITAAAKHVGCSKGCISQAINGKVRTAMGYRWEAVKMEAA